MRAPLLIHLCVVNHCGEKATFYLSDPNPDHMATPSPAHSSSSPPLSLSALLLLLLLWYSLWTLHFLLLLLCPPFFSPSPTVHQLTPSRLHFLQRKLPPCFLPLAMQHVCTPVCVCVRVCVRAVGRWGQASLAVSYNQPSRVPVMLCIVRTHH